MRPPIGGVRLEDATYDWLEEIERKLSKRSGARRFGMNKAISMILDLVQNEYPIVIADLLDETLPSQDAKPDAEHGPRNSHTAPIHVYIADRPKDKPMERQAANGK